MLNYLLCSKLRILITFISVGIIIVVAIIFCPKMVNAEAGIWSWSSNKPVVCSSNLINGNPSGPCLVSNQKVTIIGELTSKKVCLTRGEKVNFGTYSDGGLQSVVSFGFDTKMYKVWGACDYYNGCLYIPGSDTLVTKQNFINGMVKSLVLYKNFTKRLKHTINGLNIGYNFDTSNPDYIFRSANGYAWPIGGYGASDDGKWLGIEFRQRGIGLLNIENLTMKRISTMSFSYGTGYDPTSEIAVSNGGQSLAIMGLNSGLTVFDINSDCGDEATDVKMSSVIPISVPCKKAQITTGDFINRFFIASLPKFNSSGGELSFYALSYESETREVSLRASGYGGQRLDYLALGDSFTSGEGETDDSNYLVGTNNGYEKCHLSTRSYPYLLANLSGIDPNYMKSVACSGAVTKDVIGDDIFYSGQGGRLGKDKLNLNDTGMTLLKTEAGSSFIPGRIHQESFVKEYQPKVITIGIGGNDAGFMDKLKACLGTDTCSWANDSEDKEQTAVEIKNLYSVLTQTYQKIHDQSPNSQIYVVGYPKIISSDGKCDLIVGKLLDDVEKQFLNEGVEYLNQVIAAASSSVGIKYIDIQDSFGGHVLCGQDRPDAMNAVRTGDDGAISDNLDWLKLVGQESFHPNPFGHSLVAESINGSVSNILDYRYCDGGLTVCPVETVVPEPSKYWIPDSYHDYPTQKIANFISDRLGSIDSLLKQVTLDSSSLAPNSAVSIEITSNPRSLGQFVTDDSGGLNLEVDLPVDIEEGYHTIHLYGTSYSGESVELYQVIKYIKPATLEKELLADVIDDVTPDTTQLELAQTDVPDVDIKTEIANLDNINPAITEITTLDNINPVTKTIATTPLNNQIEIPAVDSVDENSIVRQIAEATSLPVKPSVNGAITGKNQSNLSFVKKKGYFDSMFIIIAVGIGFVAVLVGLFVINRIRRVKVG